MALDSVYCDHCGAHFAQESTPKIPFQVNKVAVFMIIVVALVGAVFYFINPYRVQPVDIELSFSPLQNRTRAIAYLTLIENPSDYVTFLPVLERFEQAEIPLTVFLTAQDLGNHTPVFFISSQPRLAVNLTSFTFIDYQTAGYINSPYSGFGYEDQEIYLQQSKKSFLDQGYRVRGFFPPLLSINLDTLLAAENTRMDYIITNQATEISHPASLLGGLMHVLLFPLTPRWQNQTFGVSVVFLDPNALLTADIQPLKNMEIDVFWTLTELNEHYRAAEASARLTTDYRRKFTTISFTDLEPNTRVILTTSLRARNVTAGNRTLGIDALPGKTSFVVPDTSSVLVQWE